MTKQEFIKRLENQLCGMIDGVERRALGEIEGSRARMDAQTFADWLRSEMDKANEEPALKAFKIPILRPSRTTINDACQSFAKFIEKDAGPNDWEMQWDSAAPILANFYPEKSDGWKYKQMLITYISAAKAKERAYIFSNAIDETYILNSEKLLQNLLNDGEMF